MNISLAAHPFARKGASALLSLSMFITTFAPLIALPQTAHAAAPECNELTATIYVEGGNIVGGPDDTQPFAGTLNGTSGDDVIVSTNAAVTINAGDGNDTICTGAGADIIDAGDGDNWIDAKNGANEITSGSGNDTIFAGNGSNIVEAGDGNNRIDLGGASSVTTGSGNDEIYVDSGSVNVEAGDGNNHIELGNGSSNVTTGSGDDYISIGNGSSIVESGAGNDEVHLGNGSNNIDGGPGTDICTAGNGAFVGDDVHAGGSGGSAIIENCEEGEGETEDPHVTVVATKVVCADETQLPNMAGGADITSTTAADWVAGHDSCSIDPDWQFEWGAAGAGDGGDATVGPVGGNYTAFSGSVNIPFPVPGNRIEMREVLEAGYIPFTGDVQNNVSAEFYCASDVADYDNWEWINNPQDGQTYHCVGFNAPEFSIQVTKYECPVNAIVSRGANGPDDTGAHTAPDGCVLKPGAEFGYYHYPAVTDGSSPYAYTEDFSTTAQTTDANGQTVFVVEQEGRYDIAELNAGNRIQDVHDLENAGLENPVLGLYCNTDPGLAEDNLDFVLAENITDGQADCVVYNAVPAPACELDIDSQEVFSGTETQVDGHDAAPLTFVHPGWTASIPGATWIWSEDPVVDPTVETTKVFTHTFNVAGTPTGAVLDIATDNFYEVEVNGNPVGSELVSNNNFQLATQDNYVITADKLLSGENTLTITVINQATPGDANPNNNPAGLLFKLVANENACEPQDLTSTVTMCKIGDDEQYLSGWTLLLKGNSVEDLLVPTNTSAGINSVNSLTNGVSYIATAVGTWLNQGGANPVDAEYSTTDITDPTWETHMDGYDGYSTDILELQINSEFDPGSVWGAYNSAHTYAQSFLGDGNAVNFRIYDGSGGVQNEGWFGDNSGTLSVNIANGYAGVTGQNGCVVFSDVPYGSYTADEIMLDGWTHVSGAGPVTVDSPEETFNIVNTEGPMCEEGERWANEVIDEDQGDRKDGSGVLLARSNPDAVLGVNDGPAVGTFFSLGVGGTITIKFDTFIADEAGDDIEVYEVTNGAYPLESAQVEVSQNGSDWETLTELVTNASTVTALDISGTGLAWIQYVRLTDNGATGPHLNDHDGIDIDAIRGINGVCDEPVQQCDASAEIVILSGDGQTDDGDGPASVVTFLHEGWVDAIDALWIWIDPTTSQEDAENETTEKFTREFEIVGTPTDALLDIAADNAYAVEINDVDVPGCENSGELNYGATTTCVIPANMLIVGTNELEIEVTNLELEEGDPEPSPETNPAGVLFKLTLTDNQCVIPEPETETGTIVIVKETEVGDNTFNFTLTNEDTLAETPVAVETEDNIGSTTLAGLSLNEYSIDEVTPDGWDLEKYSCISNFGHDEDPWEIDLHAGEVVTCTFLNVLEEGGGNPEEPGTVEINVSSNTSAGENQLGWLFNRDPGTQSPYEFNADEASHDTGSLFVFPIQNSINGNNDKFIGELFLLDEIADINSISYDFMIASTSVDAEVDEDHFYMNVYANFGESSPTKFYDCRYNIVPTNGVIDSFATVTFDPTQSYPVTTRTGAEASPHTCPASPAGMDALSTGSSTIRVIALNVGDSSGSDLNVSGYFDKVVVNTDTLITTYDFEPAPLVPIDEGGDGDGDNNANSTTSGGGGGSSFSALSQGEVLGASTDDMCVEYLHEYIKYGAQNNQVEVLKLQTFLNDFEANNLTLSGIYDDASHNAVHAFQKKYQDMVLTPWGATRSTGFVYYTTKKTINEIYCRFTKLFPLNGQQEAEIARVKALGAAWSSDGSGNGLSPFAPQGIQLPSGTTEPEIGTTDTEGTVAGTSTEEEEEGGILAGIWNWLIGR